MQSKQITVLTIMANAPPRENRNPIPKYLNLGVIHVTKK